MKGTQRSNSTNNTIFVYKPEAEAASINQVVKNKVNMHISVARKNDAIKKIMNNLSSEFNPSDKGVIDMAVKLDIRKWSLSKHIPLYLLEEGTPIKKLEPMAVNIQNQNSLNKNRTISEERLESKKAWKYVTKTVTEAETPEVYLNMSKRIFYTRRLHYRDRPLMIIFFEGVIGFTIKSNIYLRSGVQKFMKRSYGEFQVVIATNCSSRTSLIIK